MGKEIAQHICTSNRIFSNKAMDVKLSPTTEVSEIRWWQCNAFIEELKRPDNYTIMAGKHFTTVDRAVEIVEKGGLE